MGKDRRKGGRSRSTSCRKIKRAEGREGLGVHDEKCQSWGETLLIILLRWWRLRRKVYGRGRVKVPAGYPLLDNGTGSRPRGCGVGYTRPQIRLKYTQD